MKLPQGFEIIKGYAKYAINMSGNILSSYSGSWKPMYPKLRSDGYYQLDLTVNGKRKTFGISRLVARQFIGERPEGKEVAHNDGVKTNNHVSNLRYATKSENALDRYLHGTMKTTLPDEAVLEVCRLAGLGWTERAIGDKFQVNYTIIHRILTGETYSHIARPKANRPRWKKVKLGLRRLKKKKIRSYVYKPREPKDQRIDSNYKIVQAMHNKGRSDEEIGLVFGIGGDEVAEIIAYLDGLGVTKS